MDQWGGIIRRVGVTGKIGILMILAGQVIGMTFMVPTLLQSPRYPSIENKDG
jgi:hypothetical protein